MYLGIRASNCQMGTRKTKSFSTAKGAITWVKSKPTTWERISASCASCRGLISRIHKELKQQRLLKWSTWKMGSRRTPGEHGPHNQLSRSRRGSQRQKRQSGNLHGSAAPGLIQSRSESHVDKLRPTDYKEVACTERNQRTFLWFGEFPLEPLVEARPRNCSTCTMAGILTMDSTHT